MPLAAGDRLGHYEIIESIGAGGMGEVFRAHDTKLKREIALKVLPDAFAGDPGRMARFQREAEVLASLNHPNIAAIYGLEDRALVMELVEGQAPKGPKSFEEAWKIAAQIAGALEYAHEKGIVHRDLKPANLKVTADGVVKVLDFGLAKAFSGPTVEPASNTANSPTLTMGATQAGVILGTAAYMSPEQAKGKNVDKRSDIWSFGVVLYELLTGEALFHGEDIADTLAQVLTRQPDFERVPAQARRLLSECLCKDPKQRLRDIGDAKRLLGEEAALTAVAALPARRSILAWTIAGLATACAAILALLHTREVPPPAPAFTFTVASPEDQIFGGFALSPDGTMLAVPMGGTTDFQLAILHLRSNMWQKLPANGLRPSWSPDGRFLAFVERDKIKKIAIAGGPPQVLCDFPAGYIGDSAWTEDGSILFSGPDGIRRVPATGGVPTQVTLHDHERQDDMHGVPQLIAGERKFLYIARGLNDKNTGVFLASLDAPPDRQERKAVLQPASISALYARGADGADFFLFARDEALMAQSFDRRSGNLTGDPFLVAPKVGSFATSLAASASRNGVLAYMSEAHSTSQIQFVWFDRTGKRLETTGPAGYYSEFSLSSDDKRLAVVQMGAGAKRDIWILDLAQGGGASRFTLDATSRRYPVWSPDRSGIIYADRILGASAIYEKPVGGGPPKVVGNSLGQPTDWSRDGHKIVYHADGDLWVLADGKPLRITQTDAQESSGAFSPDGKWLAYTSDETHREEVWVQPYPPTGARWQVSSGGGSSPHWSPDGRELFYLSGDSTMTAVAVNTAAGFQYGGSKPLFKTQFQTGSRNGFALSHDGHRFLIPTRVITRSEITIMTNWVAAARK